MAESTDVILPILQRIQSDVADLKRDVADLKQGMADVNTKLSEMNGYLSFNLGITSRHSFEIDAIRKEGEAVKRCLHVLEIQP